MQEFRENRECRRSKIKERTVENFLELKRHESSDSKGILNAEQKKVNPHLDIPRIKRKFKGYHKGVLNSWDPVQSQVACSSGLSSCDAGGAFTSSY